MPFDPRGNWRPNRKQEQFLSLPTSIFEAGYLGGAGSGKSEVLLIYPIVHKWHENPKFKQVFMRRTFPEIKREIVGRARELYRPFGAKFNQSDMVWTFMRPDQYGSGATPDGAQIFLGHCENEDDVHKYDSMEINLFTPDEITTFTQYIYTYIGMTRVRTNDTNLPAIVRCAGMPGGVGHSWVKKRFVDPAPHGGKIIVGKGGNKRIFIHATQADNPHVDPTYQQKLAGLPTEAEKQAKLYGSFDAYLGQVFEEFRDRHFPDEPDNALHVIEPFDIPDYWSKIVVGDWGYRAMLWVGFGAISPDKRLYIYRELAYYEKKIAEWGPILREYVEQDNPQIIKFCQSVGQARGYDQTLHTQIEEILGRSITVIHPTPGSRVAGKTLLHEYLRWRPRRRPPTLTQKYDHEHALWLIRNRTDLEYQSYVDSFKEPEPELNLPKLQIFNTVKELPISIKACVYAKSKEGKVAEDVAEFDGDDPYEGIRNMIDEVENYVNEVRQEFAQVQARAALAERLKKTNDWTAFYREAQRVESQGRIKPIQRYH